MCVSLDCLFLKCECFMVMLVYLKVVIGIVLFFFVLGIRCVL